MKKTFLFIFTILLILLPGSYWLVYGDVPLQEEEPEDFWKTEDDFDQIIIESDAVIIENLLPPRLVVVDPDPEMQDQRNPLSEEIALNIATDQSPGAIFSITYKSAGSSDLWGATCSTFPTEAKTAFNAAAAIWANTIESAIPITISACWSNLGSSNILGYSGGQLLYANFSGAPRNNTWYQAALANALHGGDLGPSQFDFHITYNSGFPWYFGTDGMTPSGTFDLVSVASHEIAHGLNFSGSAKYSTGVGSYKYGEYPVIYDTFIEDVNGFKLSAYENPSLSLGNLFTSNNLWWNGANANAANGGLRVKIYAPTIWSSGSSYSHLDYNAFAGTPNSLMVFAIASGSSQHSPGEVTKGILEDMGWKISTPLALPGAFNKTSPSHGITGQATTLTLTWGSSSDATSYEYCYDTTNDNQCAGWVSNGTNTTKTLTGLSESTTYYWHVRARNAAGLIYSNGSSSAFWQFKTRLNPPGSFSKTSPANNAAVHFFSANLEWSVSSSAESYEYCYDTNVNGCTNWVSNGASTSRLLSGLSPDTTYYWHVRSYNSGGTTYSNGDALWRFRTGNPVDSQSIYLPLVLFGVN